MDAEEIKKLKRKRDFLLEQLNETECELDSIGRRYEKFFRVENKKFKLYKKLPHIENLKAYLEFCDIKDEICDIKDENGYDDPHHPLDKNRYSTSYSYFNLEELAILLKMICQLQTGKEYGIITLGNMTEVPALCNVYPQLHYLIGTNPNLEQYREHNGIFYEEMNKFQFKTPQNGLIAIPNIASNRVFDNKGLIDSDNRYGREMQYYEYKTVGKDGTAYFDRLSNIFKEYLKHHIGEINSHCDIFTFPISVDDEYISNILISIIMYKKANGIKELSEEDYGNIMFGLYGENVSIRGEVETTIPKKLTYVKSDETRKRFESQLLRFK